MAGCGALPGLPVTPAGLCGLPPVHEPRGRGASLPHPPEAGRVWNLHDQHAGWGLVDSLSAVVLLLLICFLPRWNWLSVIYCASVLLGGAPVLICRNALWFDLTLQAMIRALKWLLIRPCCLHHPIVRKNDRHIIFYFFIDFYTLNEPFRFAHYTDIDNTVHPLLILWQSMGITGIVPGIFTNPATCQA